MAKRIYPSVIPQERTDLTITIKIHNRKNGCMQVDSDLEFTPIQQALLEMFMETVSVKVIKAVQDIIYD